jgi:hypothetical protein
MSLSRDITFTDCGLPGIRKVPYGVHMCHFYQGPDDLAEALVPYFMAGLRNRERCLWVTAQPLEAEAAKQALGAAGLDAGAAIGQGSLVVRDFSDWYAQGAELKGADVVDSWLEEERRALADGYAGLRITGNVSFLTPHTWPEFMEYEALLDKAFHGRRIVTLCSYRLGDCDATEVLEVVRRHNCTLDRPDEGWQILTTHP